MFKVRNRIFCALGFVQQSMAENEAVQLRFAIRMYTGIIFESKKSSGGYVIRQFDHHYNYIFSSKQTKYDAFNYCSYIDLYFKTYSFAFVCACVWCAVVCACVRARVCVCVCVCVGRRRSSEQMNLLVLFYTEGGQFH